MGERQDRAGQPDDGADDRTVEDREAQGPETEDPGKQGREARDSGEHGHHGATRANWDDRPEFDEAFIRSAEVSEPAARTRMLRKRWGNRPPEPQPWRADAPPAGWFFSKGRRRSRRKRRRDEE